MLNGAAHVAMGIRASGGAFVEPVALLWWVAGLGFILAGFRLLHWPAPLLHPFVLSLAATIVSVVMLFLTCGGIVIAAGVAVDLVLVDLVRRCTREWPVYAADGTLLRGASRVRRRHTRRPLRPRARRVARRRSVRRAHPSRGMS